MAGAKKKPTATSSPPVDVTAAIPCTVCGGTVPEHESRCPSCAADAGYPNVRMAKDPTEVAALARRFDQSVRLAKERSIEGEFRSFVNAVGHKSKVVVALWPTTAFEMFRDPNKLYTNYESLVRAKARTAANRINHNVRSSVASKLFGAADEHILYGVLSLDNTAPCSYGSVFLTLRDIAVQHRVSFLESNSYVFVTNFGNTLGSSLPKGYRSDWATRELLAGAKLEGKITSKTTRVHWPGILMDGASGGRSEDEFIEAHIFGPFNFASVEKVSFSDKKLWADEDKALIKALRQLLAKDHPNIL